MPHTEKQGRKYPDNTWFYILSGSAIIMLVASFIVPPTGVIDPSVLAAVGIIFAFAALRVVIKAIDKGTPAKITKGDTSVAIGDREGGQL